VDFLPDTERRGRSSCRNTFVKTLATNSHPQVFFPPCMRHTKLACAAGCGEVRGDVRGSQSSHAVVAGCRSQLILCPQTLASGSLNTCNRHDNSQKRYHTARHSGNTHLHTSHREIFQIGLDVDSQFQHESIASRERSNPSPRGSRKFLGA